MRYLKAYIQPNFQVRKYWSKMANVKTDNLINHFIEDIVTKNIDSHFFQKNEEESHTNDEQNKSNSDLNSEDFFKLKADEDKLSEGNLNLDNDIIKTKSNENTKTNHSNTMHEQNKTLTDINPTESQMKTDFIDVDDVDKDKQLTTKNITDDKLNDIPKSPIQEEIVSNIDSKNNQETKKVSKIQQQELDEMEFIKFKEHVDSFKMELMQMNKNLGLQQDKFKETSLTIYEK